MKCLAVILAMMLTTQAFADTGVSSTGVSYSVDTEPDYILIMGDPQVGVSCADANGSTRWARAFNDADHQLCGAAGLAQTDQMIRDAFANYPIDLAVIEGDLTDTTGQWQVTQLTAMIDALPTSISSKLRWVGGNHDASGTNCGLQWRYHSTKFLSSGAVSPLHWEEKLRHTRLFGIQSSLISMDASTPCHAQDDSLKHVNAGPYGAAVCFGDETEGTGGVQSNNTSCTDGPTDCLSGQCGIWEDMYASEMTFIAEQFAKFSGSHSEEVLIMNGHQALCRSVLALTDCENTESNSSRVFDRMQNLKQCSGASHADEIGKYCDIVAHNCGTVANINVTDPALCVTARTGFETRDTILAHVESVDPEKQGFVMASGHVGSTERSPDVVTDQFTSGTPFLQAETVGAATTGLADVNTVGGLVIRVAHNTAPTIIAYVTTTNNSPVIGEIGTAGAIAMSASGQFVFNMGTDPDYESLDWHLSEPSKANMNADSSGCLVLDQKVSTIAGDTDANLDSNLCGPGRYPPSGEYEICLSDGTLVAEVPTGDGITVCANFHVDVS